MTEKDLQELEQAIYDSHMAQAKVETLKLRLQYGATSTEKGGFKVSHKWCAEDGGLTVQQVTRAIKTGKLKAIKVSERKWDVWIEDWQEYKRLNL